MPGYSVTITFMPGATVDHLETVAYKMRNQEPMLLEIGQLLSEQMLIQFTGSGMGRWPPLKESTIRRKMSGGALSTNMLVRSGLMQELATSGQWNAGRIGTDTFQAVLEVPGYSTHHFEGTIFMPIRDYALIPDSVEGELQAVMENWLFGGMV